MGPALAAASAGPSVSKFAQRSRSFSGNEIGREISSIDINYLADMSIGSFSYGIGAVAFLTLFLLLLTSWRGRLKGALLVVAVFVTMVWALVSAYYAEVAFRDLVAPYRILEVARNIAWIVFLFHLAEPPDFGDRFTARVFRFLYPGILLFAGLVIVASLFPNQFGRFGIDMMIFAHVSLAVSGLALIQQLFYNTRIDQLWATKFLYLGVGAMFAYDVFLYTDALLFKRIDQEIWNARGLVYAMAVPFIAVSAARNRQWSLDVFLSRRFVIHSASVIGSGLYLLVMVGVSYYIRRHGGSWGTAIQVAFMSGATMLLLIVLFSAHLRAHLKVFLNKHFFTYKYDYREEWLKFIGTLSVGESEIPLRERAIHAVAELLDSPGGMLWTRSESGNFSLSATWNMVGSIVRSEHADSSLVKFLERRQWVIDLAEYDSDPNFYQELALPDWLRQMGQAWLVVPMMHGDLLRGFLVLAKPRVKRKVNWEDHDLLKTAGRQVASFVALLDATDALMDARQFEAFNRLSAYVVHDLKNITAQLSLIVSNAARHRSNPAFVEDAIGTVENASAKMNRMLAQLRKGSSPVREITRFDLHRALQEAIAIRSACLPVPVLSKGNPDIVLRASRDRFTAVLEHLIQNAQEATAADGLVELRSFLDGRFAVVEIADNGCGMSERFIRERLFRPFNTTKGNAGMGIGVYESREFVLSLGGEVDVFSEPGIGTTFYLRVPIFEEPARLEANQEVEVVLCASRQKNC